MSSRRCLYGTRLALALAASLAGRTAAAVDLAQYLMPTPGHWTILERNLDGEVEYRGTSVEASGDGLLRIGYRSLDGSSWELDEVTLHRVDSRNITFLGGMDGSTGAIQVAQPPVVIPRSVAVGKPVLFPVSFYSQGSSVKAQSGGEVLMVVKTGLTATPPAGTFTDCIQAGNANIYMYFEASGSVDADSELTIKCPGYGDVEGRGTELSWEVDPGYESGSEIMTLVEFGDANPPFPPLPSLLRAALLKAAAGPE